MPSKNRPLTDAEKAKILEMHRGGSGGRAIAEAIGREKTVVNEVVAQARAKEEAQAIAAKSADELLHDKVRDALKRAKKPVDIEHLANQFDVGPKRIAAAVEAMKALGFNVHVMKGAAGIEATVPPSEPSSIDVTRFKGRRVRFGVTADNHLGSKYERLDVLNALYDIWEQDGITKVYQLGNMIDGEARFNKFDIKVHGMQAQADYFAEHWPARDGMVTEFVTGDDHEGWYVQREGVNIGNFLENAARKGGREDIRFLGHMEHDIMVEGMPDRRPLIRLIHAGGGTAYALSYKAQQIINSYQGGEKPTILLIGHYHKAEFNYWREVLNLMGGCTEDQTPFMRKKSIQAHLGGWTVEFDLDDQANVHRFRPEFHPFYDREFYSQWKYLH